MTRERYQQGSVTEENGVWVLRYRERDNKGNVSRRAVRLGSREQHKTKRDAKRAAEAIMKDVRDRKTVVYFRNLLDRYEADAMPARHDTARGYTTWLKRMRDQWGERRLDWMASPPGMMEIEQWLRTITSKKQPPRPLSLKSRKHIKSILHDLFRHAIKWGCLPLAANPIAVLDLRNLPPQVRTPKPRATPTVEQYYAVLADKLVAPHVRVMVQLAVMTGLRASEILGLRWDDIDYGDGLIWVRRSWVDGVADDPKTEMSGGSYPMHDDLAAILRRWSAAEPSIDGWLFGSPYTDRPYNRDKMQVDYLEPAGRRAGINGLGWHGLRHLYRRLAAEIGEPLEVQQYLMRHAHISTTMLYGKKTGEKAEFVRGANARIVEMLRSRKNGTD